MHKFNTAIAAKYQVSALALIINGECVCIASQNSFYHFTTVVTRITFGLLAVSGFLESSNMPTTDKR